MIRRASEPAIDNPQDPEHWRRRAAVLRRAATSSRGELFRVPAAKNLQDLKGSASTAERMEALIDAWLPAAPSTSSDAQSTCCDDDSAWSDDESNCSDEGTQREPRYWH